MFVEEIQVSTEENGFGADSRLVPLKERMAIRHGQFLTGISLVQGCD